VDELKEFNLRISEEPRAIYIRSLFTSKEEKEYFDVLSKCKGVFA